MRVHFKKAREVGAAIKGKTVDEATTYLKAVLEHKRGVPMRRFTGGCGRHSVGKLENAPGNCVAFPLKATNLFLDMLKNAASNAEAKGLNSGALKITHVQVNQAPKTRRRTYRAHGRITAYQGHPCHVELALEDAPKKLTAKRLAQLRVVESTA